jgi:hypothetical protein
MIRPEPTDSRASSSHTADSENGNACISRLAKNVAYNSIDKGLTKVKDSRIHVRTSRSIYRVRSTRKYDALGLKVKVGNFYRTRQHL